jgi:predicted nucleotidyltransferase
MLTDSDVGRISGRIARHLAPVAVGVFGSYATGSAGAGSDLDLFVIRHTCEPAAARRQAVGRLLIDVLHPVDIQVFTPAEFEATAYEYLSFTWVIARQARLYHWSADAAREVPALLPRARTHFPG